MIMTSDVPQTLEFEIEIVREEHWPWFGCYMKFEGERIMRREDGRWVSCHPDWRVETDGSFSHRDSWGALGALTQRRARRNRRR